MTEISHNYPDGIKDSETIAIAVYLARIGKDKAYIRERMSECYPKLKDKYFAIEWCKGNYGYDDSEAWITCSTLVNRHQK